MTRTRSMTAPKNLVNDHGSTEVDFLSLSSNSDIAESSARPFSSKKRTSSVKKKSCKKARSDPSISFEPEDMHKFWGVEQNRKFEAFKKRPIVPGRVINLEQLEDSHCPVISLFRTQKLSLLLRLCGPELYEEPVRLFYANLRISEDSGDLET